MSIKRLAGTRMWAYAVLAAFGVFILPVGLAAGGEGAGPTRSSRTSWTAPGAGSLAGFVYGKDLKTPLAGAVVKVRNVADMKELASAPTDKNGMYTIPEIPEGRYVLGISAGDEVYNFDYALYVKAGELGKLSVGLVAPGVAGQAEGATGAKKKGFFNTLAGHILVITAVGVGLYFLIHEPESSPIR